ncbi:MAG TPA: beta-ketoacyl synthase N-terminal-like domain-containing protein, partial [Albitalea sp.]|nr:beta-ketoacyl synthase N-terminal-like domain-containing protein [Albitalea sp.]
SCSRWGGFIDGIEQFDAAFFGISPREADAMDPQQRLLLQTTWHALEDAGIRADALAGSDAGVFIGAMTHDYELLQLAQGRTLDAYFGSGTQSSVLANRISYVLGLQGPSWTVQTACSSSLVALHQARSSLLAGECGLAIVGGVNALLAPELFVALSQAQMLSPDGRCRAFDARANGYVRSEGCAVLVLKRLADAERDGDRVLGLVAGSAVNQDGRSNGLTAPNGLAQQAVMRRALASAGVEAAEVDCVEAHGTGTALGDPIEVDAIVQTYGRTAGDAPPLSIGSVKSNIGHTEPVAGLAGVVKLLLALHHERIPRTLHVEQINPHIDLRASRCAIATESRPWPRGPRPRLGGVSSFGFGGTNAHVVLREPPADPAGRDEDAALPPRVELLMLSARSEAALHAQARRLAARLAARLADAGSLRALCHTANARRTPMVHRAAFVGATRQELASSLGRFTCGEGDEALRGQVLGEASGRTAFLFSGQGSHDASMGHGLYRTQRVFRRTFDRCDEVLAPRLGFSLAGALYGGQDGVLDLGRTAHAQPALFALEMALAALWQSLGARPDCLLGHSLGEYAAACVAGVFSLEDAALLVAERGRLMDSRTPQGAMVAVHAAEPTLSRLMCEFAASDHHEVAIAARNSADSVVLSGSADAVDRVLAQWAPHGASATPLAVARAFHSPLMEPMLAEFEHCLRRVAMKAPSITLVSNITGRAVGEQAAEVSYWLDHVRKPVEFLAGMRCLDEMGCRRFIEIGPHPVLCRLGQRSVEGGHWLPSLQRGDDDERRFALSLAAWGVQGGEVDWTRWAEDRWPDQAPPSLPRPVTLPAYPFQTEAHWFAHDRETPAAAVHAAAPAVAPATLTAQPAPDPQVLAALPPEEAKGRVLDWLRAITGTVLRLGAARQREIAPLFGRMPLNQLGLDSLMAVELRQRIHAALGVELPLKHFLTDTTAGDVAAMVYRLLAVQRLARDAAAPAEAESIEELLL